MIRIPRFLVLAFILSFLSGCATIIHGTTQTIPISTIPPGALVTTERGNSGVTPCEFLLTRRTDHSLTITKEGYKTEFFPIGRKFSYLFLLNTATTPIGAVIFGIGDLLLGGVWNLYPKKAEINLQPTEPEIETIPVPPSSPVSPPSPAPPPDS